MKTTQSPAQLRELIRNGKWNKPTSGSASGYLQANLVMLPAEEAFNFLLFCVRNPKPKLVVLDEPTSSLDRSVQFQVINLLRDLQLKYGLTYLFITHDLKIVKALCHDVIVMKSGVVVEAGPAQKVFKSPEQDYTRSLLSAAFE